MNVCIIPAREGSKRIPGKNKRLFKGRPIIEWPLEQAKKYGFDRIVISTDDDDIFFAYPEYKLRRRPWASGDHSTLADVVTDYLDDCDATNICVILPTAVSVSTAVILRAKLLLDALKADCVFTMREYPHPIERAFQHDGELVHMVQQEHSFTRTQDLPKSFYDVGQMYWLNAASFEKFGAIFMPRTTGIIIDAIDIDTEEDWQLAEQRTRRILEG